jgi:hypothetical protein
MSRRSAGYGGGSWYARDFGGGPMLTSRSGGSVSAINQWRRYCVRLVTGRSVDQMGSTTFSIFASPRAFASAA